MSESTCYDLNINDSYACTEKRQVMPQFPKVDSQEQTTATLPYIDVQ